jgi:hypothetical protein
VKKRTTTDAKSSANRRNARHSTGPKDTSSTRLNATKHGLLSEGITELDDTDGYRDTVRRLGEAYFEKLEAFLVERIALCIVRLRRTPRLEAELITSILHPPIYGELLPSFGHHLIDPGQPARIDGEGFDALARYQRYEFANENKLYRALNQLERIRRIQQGEHLPAPVSVDLVLHSKTPGTNSAGAIPFESTQKGPEVCTADCQRERHESKPPVLSELTKATEEPD